ncbi:ABC transporter permease [Cryobacterium tepidiphilum]|uniref:ABC transporter permease n=1 Tax=Cryobacterium tepidiphilum TaxID=2486026 RepID=A0A3M8LMN2_9MICO|nr:FtsX-like permease family protein [Cryobacterium tepidiphilum]RNE66787.1 ABC transporter permease [Cryobacterium tepidiphilum]
MFRLTIKQVLAQRLRLALTLLAVVLGVTFVTGSLVLTDTSQKLFDDQFRTATEGADFTVRSAAAFDSAMGVEVERDPLPHALLERVAGVDGVATAAPVAKGQGLLEFDGDAIVPAGASLLTTWVPEPLGAFSLRAGTAPNSPDEVVIDVATANAHGITVGDTVTVRAEEARPLTVVGLVGFGSADGLPNSTVAITTLASAQHLLGLGDGFSDIMVVKTDAAGPDFETTLTSALGASYEAASSRDLATASADAAKGSLEYLQIMLLALAAASLLIGAFLIANTFSIVITQRTRELAVLRAAGATSAQLLRSVLGEALLVGITASVAGVGLGIAAALGLRQVVGAFGVPLPDGDVSVTPRTIAISLVIGIVVTLVSALAPARRAASVSPIAAMRDNTAGGASLGRARTAGGAITAVAGVAAVVTVVAGAPVALLGLGAVLTIVGLTLLGPVIMPPLARVVGRPLHVLGVPGQLAAESAARAPRRTASTTMALALGLTLIMFVTIVASSVKDSIASTYKEVISADYVVESARGEMLGGLPPMVHHHLSQLDEVAVASRLQYGHWRYGTSVRALTAIDPDTIGEVASVDMVKGALADVAAGGVVVSEQVADDLGLDVGDEIPMTFARTGEQQMEIVGLIDDQDAQALSTDYLISLGTYAKVYTETMDASVFLRTAPGVSAAEAHSAITNALADFPTAEVRDQAAAISGRTMAVDQILGLVTVLLMLALTIALLGITNTLALSVIERTREIGLLRSVGMVRSQLRALVQAEAVLVAVLAVILGTALGTGFGVATVVALGQSGPLSLNLPISQLLLLMALTAAAGLVAGILPARRASNLNELAAIAQG